MSINQLMTFGQVVMTYKIVNQLYPEGLQNKFIERWVMQKYNKRCRRDLHVPKYQPFYLSHAQRDSLPNWFPGSFCGFLGAELLVDRISPTCSCQSL